MPDTGYHLDVREESRTGSPGSLRSRVGLRERSHVTNRYGFTLLEITLAAAVLGMMSLAIFRFVQSNLTALRVSADVGATEAQYEGLRDLLTADWQNLTPRRAAMRGEPFKLNDRQRDEIEWNSGAGPGLLTRYAAGDFTVSLRLQPENGKSDRLDLGFLRTSQEDWDDSDTENEDDTWVPLIKNVKTLKILYFDPRLNTWIDRWSDGSRLPALVKLTVGRSDGAAWEAIIPLRRTPYSM